MRRSAPFLVAAWMTSLGAASPAMAQSQTDAPGRAGDACETAVRASVERTRGRDAQVQFVGGQRMLSPISDVETGVRGEGRYRTRDNAMPFTYSCVFNPNTGETSGVVLREGITPQAAATAVAADPNPPILTTEACETAVVKSLQTKYPRADRVVFGSDSRRIGPAANARTSVDGAGALVRAPGMSSAPFSYRCVFDVRTGKVDSVQTAD